MKEKIKKLSTYTDESDFTETKTHFVQAKITESLHKDFFKTLKRVGFAGPAKALRHMIREFVLENQEIECNQKNTKNKDRLAQLLEGMKDRK